MTTTANDANGSGKALKGVWLTLPPVAVMWAVMFVWKPLSFWLLMSCAQAMMITAAFLLRGDLLSQLRPRLLEVGIGVAAAAVLWVVFFFGHEISVRLTGFAADQIDGIYSIRADTPRALIGALLLLLIGPGEEIYWRGLVQRTLEERFGRWRGLIWTCVLYTGVHLVAWNLMLIGAAAVCGLFWGLLFSWRRSLLACVVSHAVWDAVVFTVLPFR